MEKFINRKDFLSVVDTTITKKLSVLKYRFISDPAIYDEPMDVWYVNFNDIDRMYRVIDIHTRGYGMDEIFQMAVHLNRWTTADGPGKVADHYPKQISNVRLAPFIWNSKGSADHWWRFKDITELREECKDVLQKIILHGIPFLDDPDSKFPY